MAQTARKSRASRGADQAQQDQPQPEDEETETETEETELPLATGTLGAGRIVYHQPQLTMPSGEVIDCGHSQWGHAKPAAAAACLRKMAAANGVRVEVPES